MRRKKSPPPPKNNETPPPSEVEAPIVDEAPVETDVVVPPVDDGLITSVSLEGAEFESGAAAAEEAAQTTASSEEVHTLEDARDVNDSEPEALPAEDVPGDPGAVPEDVASFAEAMGMNTDAPVESESVDGEQPAGDHPGPARSAPRSVSELHLRGIIESLVFVADKPIMAGEIAKVARADVRDVRRLLEEIREDYRTRGIHLDELAGGWQFRSSAVNAPFVRELLQAKPIRLTRAQVETLAILAYRQPITRPEIDEIRGVDSGSAIKVLLDRELVRILGRKEDVGRPVLYGTTTHFLEFFGLKSLRDLPTLREFTELTPESEATLVRELGDEEVPVPVVGETAPEGEAVPDASGAADASQAVQPDDAQASDLHTPGDDAEQPVDAVAPDDEAAGSGEHVESVDQEPAQDDEAVGSGERAESVDQEPTQDDEAVGSGEHAESGDREPAQDVEAASGEDDGLANEAERGEADRESPEYVEPARGNDDEVAIAAEALEKDAGATSTSGAEQAEVDGAVTPPEARDEDVEAESAGAAEQAEVGEVEERSGATQASDEAADVGERHDESPGESGADVAEPENTTDPE